MKTNKFMLTAMIVSCIGSTAMASTNNQIFSTGQYRNSVEANSSILYGTDINVTQHNNGKVVENIIAGGYNNMVQYGANNSLTVGSNNNNFSANSMVSGFHNTITQADNSVAGGTQNASHSSNTLVFGDNNAIDFHSDNSIAGGLRSKLTGSNSFAMGTDAKVNGNNSFAFGEKAKATGNNAIAIGKNLEALGDNSINIGADNEVANTLSNGIIIGTNNKINKYYSDGLSGKNIVAIGNSNVVQNSKDAIAIGGGIVESANRSIAIGDNSKVAVENSVALGYDSFAADLESTDSIAINGTTYKFAGGIAHGTVGIGARGKNGKRTITGLAAGRISEDSTDAVNGSQLHAVVSEVENNANAIKMNSDIIKELTNVNNNNFATINDNLNSLDTKINTLDSKINTNQKEARKGIASASALAALHPLDYNPDHKVDIMAGVGHYRGNTAVALGIAYRPNENIMFTVGTSINGKDTAINAGVSYKVGAKDIQYRSPASMAKDIDDLKAIVNQLVQENEALKNQNK